jgi:hypothetical protein
LRITEPSPMVSRSVQTGTFLEKIATSRPICTPSAFRYSTNNGEPANSTSGFDRTSALTTQKRKYARLQIRIRWGFHLPIRVHFTRTGKAHTAAKPAAQNDTARRYISNRPEPSVIHS